MACEMWMLRGGAVTLLCLGLFACSGDEGETPGGTGSGGGASSSGGTGTGATGTGGGSTGGGAATGGTSNTGGGTNTGGTGSGASSNSGGAGGDLCASFVPDDCGSCSCFNGEIACTDVWCPECIEGETMQLDCNSCTCESGYWSCTEKACGETCGGIAGLPCKEGEFCAMAPGSCQIADGAGTCQVMVEICPANFDPVCGCDGNTYPNECAANSSGVSIDHRGDCETR